MMGFLGRHRRWMALLVLVVAAIVAAVAVVARRPPPASSDQRTPPSTVAALGRLEPEGHIINVGAPAGARVDRFEAGVRVGARVSKGDVLAYLDTYDEATTARDHAASQLAEAVEQRRAEEESGLAAIDDANLRIRRAGHALRLRIEAQDAEVRRSAAELDKLRADLGRAEKLHAGGAILRSQYDAAVLAVRQAEELLRRNRAILAESEEDQKLQLQAARAALRSAQAGRVRGELSARVQTLREALKLAEARLDLTRIRAPTSGDILEIVSRPGESMHAQPLLRMGNTDTMMAIAEVYETDVQFVREGQRATITSRAFDETITGRVERIGRLIHRSNVLGIDPTAAADARVVEVRIRLDSSTTAARYNQHQVDVEIDTRDAAASSSSRAPAAER